MAIDFPDSPSLNDTYVAGGKTYKWDGTAWEIYGPNFNPDILYVDTSNNRVGVNNTSPTVDLDVTGDAKVSSDFTVDTNTLHVDSATNRVGIGTTSPAYTVDIVGSSTSGTAVRTAGTLYVNSTQNWNYGSLTLQRDASNTSNSKAISFPFEADSDDDTNLYNYPNILLRTDSVPTTGSTAAALNAGIEITAPDTVRLGTNGAERMRVNSSGNVGIGTTSPSQKLDVNGSIVVPVGSGIMFDRGGTDSDILFKETASSSTYGTSDDVILRNPNNADILFQTGGTNTRMTINSSGRIEINGSTQPGADAYLYIEGATPFSVYYPSTSTTTTLAKGYSNVGGTETLQFTIRANGDFESRTNSYGATSDATVKQDIVDAPSQWDDIKAVQLRKYRLIDDVATNGDDALVQLGVVAQELEAAGLGGLVVDADPDNDKPHKSVKYSVLFLKALGALQEAMARIEALEAG